MIYLDNNSTTRVLEPVADAMRPFLTECYANPSSAIAHFSGLSQAIEIEKARLCKVLGAERGDQFVMTSGATESNNLAIFGVARVDPHKRHVITSSVEHPSVLEAIEVLRNDGYRVTILPVGASGIVEPQMLSDSLCIDTLLVSIMMANNEAGVIQPMEEIGKIAQEADVFFHTDAVQAAGKVPIDVKKIACDALSISGHKLHAPQGTGALFIKKGTLIQPQIYGGSHERQRRAGTENLPGIVGIGKAAEISKHWLESGGAAEMTAMRDRLQDSILAVMDDVGVNGLGAPRVPNTTNLWFDHVEGEALVIALDLKGLAVSSGAACSSGAIEPSHVLLAMGLPHQRARASIRLSLGKQTTQEDIDFAIKIIPDTVGRLREISPAYQKQPVG